MSDVTHLFHTIQIVLANTVRQENDVNYAEIEKQSTGLSLFMSARITCAKYLNYL